MNTIQPEPVVQGPPQWLVKRGETIVGPVPTHVLLRGITNGRVAENCRVRELNASSWRAIGELREVARMRRQLARTLTSDPAVCAIKPSLRSRLIKAQSASEVLLFALAAAAAVTHAEIGVAIRVPESWQPPAVNSVFGDGLYDLLGLPVASSDLSLAAARAGRAYRGVPENSAVHRAAAQRLCRGMPGLASLMMVPVGRGAELAGMLELGRSGHSFRRSDLQALIRISRFAWQRIEQLERCRAQTPKAPAAARAGWAPVTA